mmetsp:Transcript_20017/g.63761  ORF Transcript_20017/g.63761 Transcript_20017/m.63761 type:complete len:1124 (-) Transcript_20017:3855-7226(-)
MATGTASPMPMPMPMSSPMSTSASPPNATPTSDAPVAPVPSGCGGAAIGSWAMADICSSTSSAWLSSSSSSPRSTSSTGAPISAACSRTSAMSRESTARPCARACLIRRSTSSSSCPSSVSTATSAMSAAISLPNSAWCLCSPASTVTRSDWCAASSSLDTCSPLPTTDSGLLGSSSAASGPSARPEPGGPTTACSMRRSHSGMPFNASSSASDSRPSCSRRHRSPCVSWPSATSSAPASTASPVSLASPPAPHAAELHTRSCFSSGHLSAPAPMGICTTCLHRICMPPPHLALHEDQADQAETVHGVGGQACMLHSCTCRSTGHAAPPCSAGVSTSRVRACTPPPHGALQLPHAPHSPTSQSTAHGCSLHTCSSSVVGHSLPPSLGRTSTSRVRDRVPRPHALLHLPHALHSPTSQFTRTASHAFWLHGRDSVAGGHERPPAVGALTTSRTRSCVPPSHDWLHALHSPHGPISQSTGHACWLHARSSTCSASQNPAEGTGSSDRRRFCDPVPHVLLHSLHDDHSPYAHFSLHGVSPHASSLSSAPHVLPPLRGSCSTCRVLTRTPPSHSTEHRLHGDQSDSSQSTGSSLCSSSLCASSASRVAAPASGTPPSSCSRSANSSASRSDLVSPSSPRAVSSASSSPTCGTCSRAHGVQKPALRIARVSGSTSVAHTSSPRSVAMHSRYSTPPDTNGSTHARPLRVTRCGTHQSHAPVVRFVTHHSAPVSALSAHSEAATRWSPCMKATHCWPLSVRRGADRLGHAASLLRSILDSASRTSPATACRRRIRSDGCGACRSASFSAVIVLLAVSRVASPSTVDSACDSSTFTVPSLLALPLTPSASISRPVAPTTAAAAAEAAPVAPVAPVAPPIAAATAASGLPMCTPIARSIASPSSSSPDVPVAPVATSDSATRRASSAAAAASRRARSSAASTPTRSLVVARCTESRSDVSSPSVSICAPTVPTDGSAVAAPPPTPVAPAMEDDASGGIGLPIEVRRPRMAASMSTTLLPVSAAAASLASSSAASASAASASAFSSTITTSGSGGAQPSSQRRDSTKGPSQPSPPAVALRVTARMRNCSPPQVAVQGDQSVHSDSWQLSEHWRHRPQLTAGRASRTEPLEERT